MIIDMMRTFLVTTSPSSHPGYWVPVTVVAVIGLVVGVLLLMGSFAGESEHNSDASGPPQDIIITSHRQTGGITTYRHSPQKNHLPR